MNGMCGIERRVGPPFQGFELWGALFPGRCPGLAQAAPLALKSSFVTMSKTIEEVLAPKP